MTIINQEFVDKLQARPYKRVFFDENDRHFGVRVYPSGSKSYVIRYKIRYAHHLKAIGSCNAMTVERARDLAKSQLLLALEGL